MLVRIRNLRRDKRYDAPIVKRWKAIINVMQREQTGALATFASLKRGQEKRISDKKQKESPTKRSWPPITKAGHDVLRCTPLRVHRFIPLSTVLTDRNQRRTVFPRARLRNRWNSFNFGEWMMRVVAILNSHKILDPLYRLNSYSFIPDCW